MLVGRFNVVQFCFFFVLSTISFFFSPLSAGEDSGKKIPCLKCHDETEEYPVLSILNTKHAVMADKSTPFAKDACQTCHGQSQEHMEKPKEGETRAFPTVTFSTKAKVKYKINFNLPVSEQNKVCLDCHESELRLEWKGSIHETKGTACTSCHIIHTERDKVLHKVTQSEVCFDCHKKQRAEIHKPSVHPIKEGKVICSDCHNPHGASTPKLLSKPTINETCYACHAEKRGPFLWEHQPVIEDCLNCHTPHGSSHKPLLKRRGPWLCQECHQEQAHPSVPLSGIGVPPIRNDCINCHAPHSDGRGNDCEVCHGVGGGFDSPHPQGMVPQLLLAKNCLNCHSQVHGSNHPGGARKTR